MFKVCPLNKVIVPVDGLKLIAPFRWGPCQYINRKSSLCRMKRAMDMTIVGFWVKDRYGVLYFVYIVRKQSCKLTTCPVPPYRSNHCMPKKKNNGSGPSNCNADKTPPQHLVHPSRSWYRRRWASGGGRCCRPATTRAQSHDLYVTLRRISLLWWGPDGM